MSSYPQPVPALDPSSLLQESLDRVSDYTYILQNSRNVPWIDETPREIQETNVDQLSNGLTSYQYRRYSRMRSDFDLPPSYHSLSPPSYVYAITSSNPDLSYHFSPNSKY